MPEERIPVHKEEVTSRLLGPETFTFTLKRYPLIYSLEVQREHQGVATKVGEIRGELHEDSIDLLDCGLSPFLRNRNISKIAFQILKRIARENNIENIRVGQVISTVLGGSLRRKGYAQEPNRDYLKKANTPDAKLHILPLEEQLFSFLKTIHAFAGTTKSEVELRRKAQEALTLAEAGKFDKKEFLPLFIPASQKANKFFPPELEETGGALLDFLHKRIQKLEYRPNFG